MVKNKENIPADICLISTSDPKGLCYINTMNLDGETNLKEKLALDCTRHHNNEELINSFQATLYCDKPDMSLVRWNCNIKLNQGTLHPLSLNQLLLRGCVLRNTDLIYGVVIYTGHETKIMLNSKAPPSKVSNVLRKMNKILYSVFFFQAFICFLFASLSVIWTSSNGDDHDYLEIDGNPGAGFFAIQVLVFLVAYSHLIPISLYVALEVLKLLLGYFIKSDLEIYYEPDDRPANVRNSDLIEELGQVEFVFSDKTGTLTCNVMEFKRCYIDNKSYGSDQRINEPSVSGDT